MTHTEWLRYWLREPAFKLACERDRYFQEQLDRLTVKDMDCEIEDMEELINECARVNEEATCEYIEPPIETSTKGTEPMTTTTITTESSVTERTSDDIIKDLNNNSYHMKGTNLIVGSCWGETLTVALNPLHSRGERSINLDKDTLKELANLQRVLTAKTETEEAEWDSKCATRSINKAESK